LTRVLLAGDDQHLADARKLKQLQRVVHHRPPADRQQVLVRDAGQLAQPRGLTARTDQPLHCVPMVLGATSRRPRTASGDRPSSQKDASIAGPTPSANANAPTPTVPPRAKPASVTDDSSTVRTRPTRRPVRCDSTSISESRGPAPSAPPM